MNSHCPPKRILIVDDNQQAADLAAELLGMHGYTTAVAYCGNDGIRLAQEFAPDVAMVDLGMPGIDGYAVATALRALPDLAELTLIAFTAWGDLDTRARTAAYGFHQHLVKPASMETILRAVSGRQHVQQ